jgi:hypothetical protein
MCLHCYVERADATGLQYTEPLCATPRDGRMSRQSGWFCAGCGHWHSFPRSADRPAVSREA